MDWILGVFILLGLVAIRIFFRRWLARRWLAGQITINQMAAALAVTGGAGIAALVFGWEIIAKGASPWLMFLPAVVFVLAFPLFRWAVISFFPAPGSKNADAASPLEAATLRHIHRDPD